METLCFVFLLFLFCFVFPGVESQVWPIFHSHCFFLAPTLCAAVQPEGILPLRQGLVATYKIIPSLVFLEDGVYFII